jgi:hypothetical protein
MSSTKAKKSLIVKHKKEEQWQDIEALNRKLQESLKSQSLDLIEL